MRRKINKVFLDLDGVLVNFVQGVFDWYELDYTYDDVDGWDKIIDLAEMNISDFWSGLANKDFWTGLHMYNHARRLLDVLNKIDARVCILTSPPWHAAGWKQDWIQENLPEFFDSDRYLIGPAKEFVAAKDALLIDDSDKNCLTFIDHGGFSILFPQPWNENRNISPLIKNNYVETMLVYHGVM